MFKNKNIIYSVVVAGVLFTGCGSSSSSSDDSTVNSGYFIDAAVNGAHYKTSSGLEGDTDIEGKFRFNTGDKVEFSLGKLILGESEPQTNGLITPKHLIVGDNTEPNAQQEEAINLLLRTLQSLDSDGNTSNGITIDSTVLTSLESLSTEHHIRDLDETTLLALDDSLDEKLDTDFDGHVDVSEDDAKTHFTSSVNEWDNEEHEGGSRNGNSQEHGKGKKGSGNGNSQEHGQGKNGNGGDEHSSEGGSEFNLDDYNVTQNLSEDIQNSLAYMGNEERLAYDVYKKLATIYTSAKQFTNIADKSEIKHIQIVKDLVNRYTLDDTNLSIVDINTTTLTKDSNITDATVAGVYKIQVIQDLYDTLIDLGNNSEIDALKVGCMVEVTDINDLDTYIIQANDANVTDIKAAFEVLRDGSYKHYWAFDKALKNKNVINGCVDTNYSSILTDKSEVYPSNNNH